MKNKPFDSKARVAIALLSTCGLLVVWQLYLSIPLAPVIGEAFGISQVTASWLGSAFGLAYAFGFLIFGPLGDRYGRKKVLVPGLGTLALLTFAVGVSQSFPSLVQLRAVQGFVAATFAPTALAYISENLAPPIRPFGIGCMSTGFLLSGIVGQLYATTISTLYGWRWAFWLLAIAYATAAFFIATQLPKGVGQVHASLGSVYRSMAILAIRPPLLAAYAAAFMLLLSFVAMYSGLGFYLGERFAVSQDSLFSIRLAGIPGILLYPLFGSFLSKWGSKTGVTNGLSVAASGLALQAFSDRLPLVVIGTGIFVAGIAATVPALIALVGLLAAEARGAGVALYTFMLFVGASFGSLIEPRLRPVGFTNLCLWLGLTLLGVALLVRVSVRDMETGDRVKF